MNELDWPELLRTLSKNATSQRGQRACLDLSPLAQAQDAERSAENIILASTVAKDAHLPSFSCLDEFQKPLERLNIHAVLDPKELMALRTFLNAAVTLKEILKSSKNAFTDSVVPHIADFRSQLSAINHVIAQDGEINESASPILQSLSEERKRLTREITRTLDQIVQRRKMESLLQDKYVTNREGRTVIPVKSGSQHDVKGLIHDSSQTKQTVFMEPEEVVPMNNRLREVQILIQEEIARILKELSDYLARFNTAFLNADQALLDCDVIFSKAKFHDIIKGQVVRLSEKCSFQLKDLKHPLLVVQGVDVIANTVTFSQPRRVLLLSGPNAGGKTILLKAIGLAAQMARCGLTVSVSENSTMPFFERIDPVVGDLQSVDQNLSSFSSHMQRLIQATKLQGPKSLLLVDEICGSTDPEEGAALARSFIEAFIAKNIFAVLTSHFGPLKELGTYDAALEHGSLEFDAKTNRPTFQLLLGFPGRSLALAVASRLGVPSEIIDRARQYLRPESRKASLELEEIESFKSHISEIKKQAEADRKEAQKNKDQYFELVRKFREQRDKWLEKALEKAEKKIENLIEDARLQRLKNKTLTDIKAELPEIIKAKSSQKPQTLDDFRNQVKPGTMVFSNRLGRQVLVQSEPDNKGQVVVLADSMRIQLPWHTLTTIEPAAEKPIQTIRRSSAASQATAEENHPELDLRGKRVDDALPIMEKWLDDCLRNQVDQVKIIHGFGTEQLKKAIRQYLSKARFVEEWKAGDHSSGGDGVTWVKL